MIKAEIKAPPLKMITGMVSSLVEEIDANFSTDGLKMHGMDPSHVAMVDIFVPAGAFESYECDKDITVGLRCDDISKILKRIGSGKGAVITLEQPSEDKLVLQGGRAKYTMRVIEPENADGESNNKVPKVEYETAFDIPAERFGELLGDVSVVSEYITISCDNDSAEIGIKGTGDAGDVSIDTEIKAADDKKAAASATYAIEYLTSIIKSMEKNTALSILYSESKPLKLSVAYEDSADQKADFYLAPRVES